MLLKGKVALVSGAGRGIGRAHALALAAAGATVFVNDRGGAASGGGKDAQTAAAVVAEIEAAGGRAFADCRDVASWDDAHRLVEDAMADNFGHAGICKFYSMVAFQQLDACAGTTLVAFQQGSHYGGTQNIASARQAGDLKWPSLP